MLPTRSIESHDSLCPASYAVGETPAGSGVLCRISGNMVATGTDPSSLRAFCWCPLAYVHDITTDGREVEAGYQACPVWVAQRQRELAEEQEITKGAPENVKQAFNREFVTRA